MSQRTFRTPTPLDALLVEQALLLAKQLQTTADDAPDGPVLARVEALAGPAARPRARTAIQAALQNQAEAAETKGRPAAAAPTASGSPGTRAAPPATS